MQNQLLMKFVLIFIGSTIIKMLVQQLLPGTVAALVLSVLVDIAFVGCIYLVLRRYNIPEFRQIMLILAGMTLVGILIETGLLSVVVGNILLLFIFLWILLRKTGLLDRWRGRGRGRSRRF